MLPEMTITKIATDKVTDAPEDLEAMMQYTRLNKEDREKVNRYVQTLLKEQCNP